MAPQKLIGSMANLFCCKPKRRQRFPCRNHGKKASEPCSCGLDTLRDGSLDFHKIAMEIGLEYCSKQQHQADSSSTKESGPIRIGYARIFSYDELSQATNSFHPSCKLGDGGYGTVYLGKLNDGQKVAVKVQIQNNDKNERFHQFMMEVELLSTLQHRNLMTLVGCTSPGSKQLLLVYEFVPNGTVYDHLHGKKAASGLLIWALRFRIAIETAQALAYLHSDEGRIAIIHSDVKTENILLDDKFHVKLADFGLCDHFHRNTNNIMLTTKPPGTYGYLDPEYEESHDLTDKSDVYSFGVVLVELISGQLAVDILREGIYLADMALEKIQKKEFDQLVDAKLEYGSDSEIRKMIISILELASRCLQPNRTKRPPMVEVVMILRGIWNGAPHLQEEDTILEEADAAITPSLTSEEGTTSCNFLRLTALSHLLLQDMKIIVKVEQACRSYGHDISSTLLFYLFKVAIPHKHNPQKYYSSRERSCHCRQYFKRNKIGEGIAQSHCFRNFMTNYIFFLAAVTETPPQVTERNYRRFCGSPNLNTITVPRNMDQPAV